MGRLVDHCIEAATEPDGSPSSARVYAGILLVTIPVLQSMVVLAIMARLLSLDPTLPNAPALTSHYLGFLRVFIFWTLLFDTGTALSLYGINVWRYLVALRTGVTPVEGSDMSVTSSDVPPTPESACPEVVTSAATTNGSSSDVDVPAGADRT